MERYLDQYQQIANRAFESGKDPSGLGRWSWTHLRGKDGLNMRVIVAYWLCKPSTPGTFTIYAQHMVYFNNLDNDRCQRVAFVQDFV